MDLIMCWQGSCWKQKGQIFIGLHVLHIVLILCWRILGKFPELQKLWKESFKWLDISINMGVCWIWLESTQSKELVRLENTRFCTSYLTLKCIHKQNHNLRTMFTFDKWTHSKWAKRAKAKWVIGIVLMCSFWDTIVYILKVMDRLAWVLHLVEKKIGKCPFWAKKPTSCPLSQTN